MYLFIYKFLMDVFRDSDLDRQEGEGFLGVHSSHSVEERVGRERERKALKHKAC